MDGRTAAEIRRLQVMAKAAKDADDTSMPSDSDEEEQAKKKKPRLKPEEVDLDLDNDGPKAFQGEVPMEWTDRAIMKAWLQRARQRMQAPQLSHWARPMPLPAQPQLPPPPPSKASSSGAPPYPGGTT